MTRTIKVNNRPIDIPDGATVLQVKEAARAAGIEPIVKGAGGRIEFRAYHPKSGAASLVADTANVDDLRIGRWRYKALECGWTDVEASNRIGSGRGGYWPASPGRMNVWQIRDAAGDNRIWSRVRALRAPAYFHRKGLFHRDGWDHRPDWRDHSECAWRPIR